MVKTIMMADDDPDVTFDVKQELRDSGGDCEVLEEKS